MDAKVRSNLTAISRLVKPSSVKVSICSKETAMRCGEAKRLMWINVDFEKNIITLNDPEKRSNPRMWKVTQKLMDMFAALPKGSQRVFGDSSIFSMKTTFTKARKRIASKL